MSIQERTLLGGALFLGYALSKAVNNKIQLRRGADLSRLNARYKKLMSTLMGPNYFKLESRNLDLEDDMFIQAMERFTTLLEQRIDSVKSR